MTNKIQLKWLLVTAVWVGCFTFCYMNINIIHGILDAREKREILKKDTLFWRENTDNINIVTKQEKQLTHGIESLKLGSVFLDDTFNKIGADYQLIDLKLEMNQGQSQGDSLPVKLSFKSNFKNGLDVIKRLQTDYTFLIFKLIKMEQGLLGKLPEFEILLDYRYRIIDEQTSDNAGNNT
jgi:hypothetical protein